MRKIKNTLILSGIFSVFISNIEAIELVDESNKKVDIYTSLRGYVGFGGNQHYINSQTITINSSPQGSYLMGLQTNSRIGIKAKLGKFSTTAELGLSESGLPSGALPIRLLFGEYDFGKAGKLIFGRTNTPSIPGSKYASDVMDNDQGINGFGGMRIASRKLQIAYKISNTTLAIIDDSTNMNIYNSQNEAVPRIALSYDYAKKDENKKEVFSFKVGGTYKYYNKGNSAKLDETNSRFTNGSGSAFHIFGALKSNLSKKTYISAIAQYGVNGDLYGETSTKYNAGNYRHSSLNIDVNGRDTHRVGGYVEGGIKFNSTISGILGAGYQYSFVKDENIRANTFMLMAQLPISVEKHFTITPQIGYYGAESKTTANTSTLQNGFTAIIRLRYDL